MKNEQEEKVDLAEIRMEASDKKTSTPHKVGKDAEEDVLYRGVKGFCKVKKIQKIQKIG